MIKTLELNNVGPSDHLEVEFGERLTVFTGDNGLGKSFILDVAWWVLTKEWAGEKVVPFIEGDKSITACFDSLNGIQNSKSIYQGFAQDWLTSSLYEEEDDEFQIEIETANALVLYAKSDGSIAFYDPAKAKANRWLERYDGHRFRALPKYDTVFHYSSEDLWHGVKVGGAQKVNGLIADWVNWQYEDNVAFAALKKGIEVLFPKDEQYKIGEIRRLSVLDSRKVPTLISNYGQPVSIIHLSSAMKKILLLLYVIIGGLTEHKELCSQASLPQTRHLIFLIDEIDMHLHPRWQRVIVKALQSVMEVFTESYPEDDPEYQNNQNWLQTQLICTTHSPLLLASLEPIFDENKDKLYTFDLRDGEVELNESPWVRQGTSTGWLTSPAFGLGSDMSAEAESAIKKAKLAVRNNVSEDEAKEIHELLVNSLRPSDPFWSFWRSRAERLGWEL